MSRGLPRSLDLSALPGIPGFRHYFRYPLHAHDFHALRDAGGRLHGWYAAKPLYGKLDARGRVDRSGGYDGGIAGVFVPSPARSLKHARLFFARMRKDRVVRAGHRNWPAIRAASERTLMRAAAAPARPRPRRGERRQQAGADAAR